MRTLSARGLVWVAARGLVALGASGCGALDWDTSGFEQLGGKSPRAIDLPGVDLGQVGNFTPTQALGRDGSLLAIAGVTDQGKVRVVGSTGAKACTATTLPEGANPGRYVPAALEDMLVVLDDRDNQGRGTLHVYDTHCDELISPLPSARPVGGSERLVPFRLLLESDGNLLALGASDRALRTIDKSVSFVAITGDQLIVVSGGRLTLRGLDLELRARYGSDVSEVALVAGGKHIAYVDAGKLLWLASAASAPITLDRDVCNVSVADPVARSGAGGPRYLSYFSPCSESNLVVYDYEDQRRIVVGPALEARAVVHGSTQEPAVFYSAPSLAEPDTPNLWLQVGDDAPVALGPGSLDGVGLSTDAGVLLWAARDEGPLVRWSEAGVAPVLDSVVAFEAKSYPERALSADGRLLQLEGVERPHQIAAHTTSVGRGSATASYFFAQVDDEVGSLRLLRSEQGEVEPVAERVRLNSASFWFTGQSLFYQQDYDAGTARGELCMRLVANADTFCEPDVIDWRVMIRPERGVALTKRVGSDVRLFWAAVN